MLHTILLASILLLEVLEWAMLAVFWKRTAEREAGDRTDAQEAQRRESRMDEGFENLMRFSVGGRDGFESTDDE